MSGSAESSSRPTGSAPPGGIRSRVERASSAPLTALGSLPVWVPFLVVLVLMLTGAFVGGWVGAVLLVGPVLFVCWLLYLGWPRLGTAERLMRLAVLAVVLAIAVTQVVPRSIF